MKHIKPSELIELALRDLESVENSRKYVVNMSFWHVRIGDKCLVCLGGAVMAMTLRIPHATSITNSVNMDPEWKPFIVALDYFRTGNLNAGLDAMGISRSVRNFYVTSYDCDRGRFKYDMGQIVDYLKSVEL